MLNTPNSDHSDVELLSIVNDISKTTTNSVHRTDCEQGNNLKYRSSGSMSVHVLSEFVSIL